MKTNGPVLFDTTLPTRSPPGFKPALTTGFTAGVAAYACSNDPSSMVGQVSRYLSRL